MPAQSDNLLPLPFHRRSKAEAMPIPSITSALRKRRLRVLIAFSRRDARLIQLFRRQGIIAEDCSTAKGEKTKEWMEGKD